MNTSIPTNQPVVNGKNTPPAQPGMLEDFVRILGHLSADKGCQEITSLVAELDKLRAEKAMLQNELEKRNTAETSNLAAIQKVMNEKDEAIEELKQKDVELKNAQAQVSQSGKSLQAAQDKKEELKQELNSTREEIDKIMAQGKKKDSVILSLDKNVKDLQESAQEAELQASKTLEMANQELKSWRKRALSLKKATDLSDM
jgi:DNA repair exonuclease SbcCD ATPase subunit